MKQATDSAIKELSVNQALAVFEQLQPISQGLRDAMHHCCKLIRKKDGEDLLKQGDFCNSFYFVYSGLLLSESSLNDRKIITWFSKPGDSATSISGLYGNLPSQERIYAYGDSLLLELGVKHIQQWYGQFPEFNIVMRKIFEYYFQAAQQRSIVVRMGSAKEKFLYYKKMYSAYFDLVPVEVVASYLGMKKTTLELIIKNEETQRSKTIDVEKCYQNLLHCMETEKVYLKNTLTLKTLAKNLKHTPHQLSSIINNKSGKNFNDFVNAYRVAYVQERFKNREEWQHLKLETLGKEAGFKSRSSFFSVFKKHVGLSPTQFINLNAERNILLNLSK